MNQRSSVTVLYRLWKNHCRPSDLRLVRRLNGQHVAMILGEDVMGMIKKAPAKKPAKEVRPRFTLA